ncbi:amidohydrolase family protein [Pseudonocardia zijingensis]|uniref:Amidohydrolase family protein n=1 Tax=Pseudonocardia zijingensis TaxID=153376 RepID=A0ABN1N7Y1_9PSEU
MRVVALEEHFVRPDLVARIDPEVIAARGWPLAATDQPASMKRDDPLADVGASRLASMDRAGISVQVLSSATPGPELLPPDEAIDFSRAYNDGLAATVREHPDRYAGFATLPLRAPEAAADELERAVVELGFVGTMVNGTTDGKFLDAPEFDCVLARAAALDVPIYVHPNLPVPEVFAAHYADLPGTTGFTASMAGWGWHSETAVHVLRLVLSGALDRHRNLKIVVGHMGEGLPLMLERFDDKLTPEAGHLSRSVSRTILDQVWITTSGIFSVPAFLATLLTFGVERILFSVDYPYADNERATRFLDALPLSPADRLAVAAGNADALLGLTPADVGGGCTTDEVGRPTSVGAAT